MDMAIFYPMFVLVALTIGVTGVLAKRRLAAVKAGETKELGYFKTFSGPNPEPENVRAAQRNQINLLELPVLFYVGCLAAAVFDKVDTVAVALAWAFVVLRILHTFVHLTSNGVMTRFRLFFLSTIALTAFWIKLAL